MNEFHSTNLNQKNHVLLSPSLPSTSSYYLSYNSLKKTMNHIQAHTELKLHKRENKNASWLNSTGAWFTYCLILVVFFLFFKVWLDTVSAFTMLNITHSLFTFIGLHWLRGAPVSDEGTYIGDRKYDKLTLWEQLDNGVQYTPTRKFLIVVPTILFLITSHTTNKDFPRLIANFVAFIIVLIPKQPFMHRNKLFGFNS